MKDPKEKEIAMACGRRIRLLREMAGLKQEQLAEILDCAVVTLSKAERGLCILKYWRLCLICDLFHVSLDFLLRGADISDSSSVPPQLIEMYRSADTMELEVLHDHMIQAGREIDRIHGRSHPPLV